MTMRQAFLLTLVLLSASPQRAALAQANATDNPPAKAPEKSPEKTPEKAPAKSPEKSPEKAPAPPTTEAPASLLFAVDLIDGIKLMGQPIDLAALPVKTEFAKLQIPLPLIASAAFNKERTLVQVRLKNGDLISGVLELERIRLRTLYGEATVPIAKLAALTSKTNP